MPSVSEQSPSAGSPQGVPPQPGSPAGSSASSVSLSGAGTPSGERTTVRVEDLHITYRTAVDRKANTLRHRLMSRDRSAGFVEVEALRGVSFEVTRGTVMGVVGSNGAGKSTLMRALAGILPPTSGRIDVYGRVSTLLALGVGFNANLTGRENVLLGGLASGLSRAEVADRYDEIAAFAGLEARFMDMPMRTYSSGMYGRLAFAVAVHLEPDILLVDEALSAGDAQFKQKAFAKMTELMAQARTIFLVSHALGSIVDLCNEAIWLRQGQLVARGTPREIVDRYTASLTVKQDHRAMEDV